MEEWWLTNREAIQLVKDFTANNAQDEVKFYMGMMAEEEQSFIGLVEHLCDVFQSGETFSRLISNFYSWAQKNRGTENAFAYDFQVLARYIIVWKLSFLLEANQQLKSQYTLKLWDPYYAAIAHSILHSSLEEETFTKVWGYLMTMFGGRQRQGKSLVASTDINADYVK